MKGAAFVYDQATDPENHAAVKNGFVKAYEGTKNVVLDHQGYCICHPDCPGP
jgi:hypothetical protein